jgi:DNA-binding beta-propeller fold protein YncE
VSSRRTVVLALVPMIAVACDEPTTPACDPTEPGTICTIAGDGKNGYSGDDGPATDARMSLPQDVLRAPDGTVYVLDWNNHRIRSLPGDGTIRHVAGRGELGGTLDDPANTDLNHPTGLALHPNGTKLEIAAWHNSKLRTIDLATGEITDSCGDGRRAYFGDGGPALTATLDLPASLAYTPTGDLIVMDQANQVMRKIDTAGTITRLAGRCVIDATLPPGPGMCAPGVPPTACAAPSGKFTCGNPATCGLPCTPGYAGDDGPALEIRMGQPFGQSADPAGRIVLDRAGTIYFADTANHVIRKITPAGIVQRVAGTPMMSGRAGDGGPALSATLFNPVDLALADDGTLYITDVYNHCVRAIAPDQTISTVAGICGRSGYAGDGGPPTEALLKRPYGLELADGVLYVADTCNHAIRSIKL